MSSATTDTLVGQLLDGRYRVVERLADGGMASVYLAVDTRLERDVALKVMRPHLAQDDAFRSRFHREARSAARLSHPGIVAVFDQGEDDGHMFLAMEFVPGKTLREVLDTEGSLTPRAALDIMAPVLDALATAHHAGIIHRDIKPENIIVRDDGAIKVADFGLARAVTSHTVTSSSGLLLGTVSYLSPEQVERGVADARSDVYAAGLVLFEMLTGTKAFDGDTAINVAYQHVHAGAPRLGDRVSSPPQVLDEIVVAATARDPEHRPVNAAAFATLVQTARRDLGHHELDTRLIGAVTGVGAGAAAIAAAPLANPSPTAALPSTQQLQRPADPPTTTAYIPQQTQQDQPPEAPPRQTRQRRRAMWPWVMVLLCAAVASATAYYFMFGPGAPTTVPAVVGAQAAQAESSLRAAYLTPKRQDEFSETVKKGVVISTTPRAGTEVRRRTTIDLVVSKGPERYAVPDVVGRALEEARGELTRTNLAVGEITEKFNEEVPEGEVISTDPKVGTSLKRDTAVGLVVSKGRQPIEVTNFTGKPVTAAQAAFDKAGLELTTTGEENHDTIPAGSIIRQDPASGTLFKGDKVNVVVSKGPVLVAVPNVVGKQIAEATATLKAAGFQVTVRQGLPGINFGTVQSTDPAPGSEVPKGTAVTVTTV